MSCTRFDFPNMPFEQGGHPLEQKKVCGERPAALLRFEPGFADPNWCRRAHVIYVVSGALEIELRDRNELVAAGSGCWLDAGTDHRARNPGSEPVVAFIASDVLLAPPVPPEAAP